MNARRFPTLIVTRITSIHDWPGMIPLDNFDLRLVCDDDLVPGTRASVLLREAIGDMFTQAKEIANAMLGFDDTRRAESYFSALPTLAGAAPQIIVAWRSSGGISYVASTLPLPHLHQEDSEYAGYDALGRIVHLGTSLEEIAAR